MQCLLLSSTHTHSLTTSSSSLKISEASMSKQTSAESEKSYFWKKDKKRCLGDKRNAFQESMGIYEFMKKPPPTLAQSVFTGLKNLWYAAGLPKTKADQLAIKKKQEHDEKMKARSSPNIGG